MTFKGGVAGALLSLALAAAPAQAEPTGRATAPGLLWRASQTADQFWTTHGTPTQCGPPQVLMADDLQPGHAGEAWDTGQDCRVWVSQQWWNRVAANLNVPRRQDHWRRWRLTEVCALMVHEVGHTRGLKHEAGTIMDGGNVLASVPGVCTDFAVREDPSPRGRMVVGRTKGRQHG